MGILQKILVSLVGFCGGVAVAAGVFAFISALGIIPRMAARMNLAKYLYPVETIVALGAVTGSVLSAFDIPINMGGVGMALFGLLAGIFVGALAMALAETLKVIPVLCQRAKLRIGLPVLVVMLGLGKALGSFYQLFIMSGGK